MPHQQSGDDGPLRPVTPDLRGFRSGIDAVLSGWRGGETPSLQQAHEAFEQQAGRITAALGALREALGGEESESAAEAVAASTGRTAGSGTAEADSPGPDPGGVRNSYRRLITALRTLEHDLEPMIPSWTGPAQETYLQCKKQWGEAAGALEQALRAVGPAVDGQPS